MEITLDMGTNIHNQLHQNAKNESLDLCDFTLNMVELGLRIFLASKENSDVAVDEIQPLLLENNEMLKEVLRCVFEPSKVSQRVFDVEALLSLIAQEAKKQN